jgi:hypothetical protein
VENMTNFSNAVAPKSVLALLCATPATDLRTSRVRSDVRVDLAIGETTAIQGKRMRVTAPTTGMGHGGNGHIVFAGYVPGSWTWSPPI